MWFYLSGFVLCSDDNCKLYKLNLMWYFLEKAARPYIKYIKTDSTVPAETLRSYVYICSGIINPLIIKRCVCYNEMGHLSSLAVSILSSSTEIK